MTFDAQRLSDLAPYLKQRSETGQAEVQELRPLTGGVSSTVIWARLSDGRQWVVKQALPKLRVQADWRADPGRASFRGHGGRACVEVGGGDRPNVATHHGGDPY